MTPDPELLAIQRFFAAESADNLAVMEDALVRLEDHPGDAELLATVFRVAHTIKGDAGNLGLAPVAELAHVMEDLLDRMRAGTLRATSPRLALLLRGVDALRALIPAAVDGVAERAAVHLSPAQRFLAAEISASAAADDDAGPAHAGSAAGATAAAAARTLRVDVAKLDRALDLLGEIAIARGRVAQLLAEGRPAREVLDAHRDADPLHTALQEVVMKLRMVPLGPTLAPFRRTVREVARSVGKEARLEVEGDDVELDTSLVEPLRDALTHLVRNAVDHGLEAPAERAAAGKDAEGVVRVSARHDGGSIVVRMSDDGAGLRRAAVERRARAAGLCADPERIPDAELFRLIWEPGFSTADAVTGLSGRGVGLDVVRRNVEALRGSVAVESAPGAGTVFTLRLPLTLALVEGFSVGVGGETYVVPLDAVVECVELPAERSDRGHKGVLPLRGKGLPFVRMRSVLGVEGPPPRREGVVVVRHEGGHAGLVVDTLLGGAQAVVKPLGRVFGGLSHLSGSTILGTGEVALILDVPAVLAQGIRRTEAPSAR